MTAQGNNDDEFDDELLSAYVDGELTAAERARVEERLRNDPLAAQLVEELRSLSSEIQRLPREPLGRDLRDNILAEIDQARADLAAHGPATLPELPIDRRAGLRRGLVWSAMAIAATIVVAIFQPPEEKQAGENVARAKKVAPAAAAPQAAQEEAESEALARDEVVELRRAEGNLQNEPANDQLADAKQKADELPPGLRAQMSAAAPVPPAGDSATLAEDAAAASAPVALAAPMSEAAGTPLEALAMESSGLQGEEVLEFKEAVPAADAALAAAEPMSDAPAQRYGMTGGAGGGMGSLGKKAEQPVAPEQSQRAALTALKASEAEGATTVTLELATPEGAEWFRELLAKSDIAAATPSQGEGDELSGPLARGMQGQGGAVAAHDKDGAKQAESSSRKLAADGAFDNEADRTELADGKIEAKSGAPSDRFYFYSPPMPTLGVEVRSRSGGEPQMVWVEASSQKIEQLLAACRAAGNVVSAVSVDGGTATDVGAPQQAGEPQASVAGAGQAASVAAPFGGAPAEASADARVRVLFVLQSPLMEASPAAPSALPAVAPTTRGEAR